MLGDKRSLSLRSTQGEAAAIHWPPASAPERPRTANWEQDDNRLQDRTHFRGECGLTADQRLLVQLSLDKVLATTDEAFGLFYQRLFELDPALRPLFKSDLADQQRKFRGSLMAIADKLDDPDDLLPELRALGRRHVGYGVKDEHYALVGEALLWALQRSVGATFTAEVREAWEELIAAVSTTMRRGAAEA
jgi:hemoglobin-like flavoprotein